MTQLSSLLHTLAEGGGPNNVQADIEALQSRVIQVKLGLASGLFTALRCKHAGTAAHSLRVALGCSSWALAMGLNDQQLDEIEVAALLHDVGKIGVPETVLLKPGHLTPEEATIMERHRHFGLEILTSCCASQAILDIVTYAPAWYDGRMKAFRLSGDALPLGARMIAIVDAFDAMTHDQVYRTAQSREQALAELFRFAGTQFDPDLVQQFNDFQEVDQGRLATEMARRWLLALDAERTNSRWELNPSPVAPGELVPGTMFQQKLLDNMHDGVVFIDSNLQIAQWNCGAERLTGMSGPSLLQRKFTPDLVKMSDERGNPLPESDCPVALALRSGVQSVRRLGIAGRNGQSVSVDVHTIPVVARDGTTYGATLLLHDASPETSLERRCQTLYEKAIKDPLTQLANRAEFDRVREPFVAAHTQRKLPCGMIICDIDHFKQVNDTYGHPAGDEVIKGFAQLLKAACRHGDLVVRYGGEEFVMLLADCNIAAAVQRAEQIRKAFAEMRHPALDGKRVTVSFGVTENQPGDNSETMLRRADRALLQAKRRGRNNVVQLGAGAGNDDFEGRRRWWFWSMLSPSASLVDTVLLTNVPMKMALEKVSGFAADHDAQVTHTDEDSAHLTIVNDPSRTTRKSDRPFSFIVELRFMEERVASANGAGLPGGSVARTRVEVTIRSKDGRERRRSNAPEMARRMLISLRSYLMAFEEAAPADVPEVDPTTNPAVFPTA